ncbi:MAG TPA: GNAT family N-acetyltransferase [Burkholderiales bacterium]|nr:GNAT family N-acetyltransferase [Burkholderiales bacterium]
MDIRDATPGDIPAIEAIYRPHVLRGLASFEEVPPDAGELARRHADVRSRGLPYLVAVQAGEVLGYGYCAPYRLRSAYRYTLEDSVYIKDAHLGRGIGSRLLAELIVLCERLDYRQLIAVIGDSANAASIALHARHGFLRAGTFRSVGYKFGRWVDSVQMQRPLGRGDLAPPTT